MKGKEVCQGGWVGGHKQIQKEAYVFILSMWVCFMLYLGYVVPCICQKRWVDVGEEVLYLTEGAMGGVQSGWNA